MPVDYFLNHNGYLTGVVIAILSSSTVFANDLSQETVQLSDERSAGSDASSNT